LALAILGIVGRIGTQQARALRDSPKPKDKNSMTISKSEFLALNPYKLASYGGFDVYEHPKYGDESPVILVTPNGAVILTFFYDLGDFNLDLCVEIEEENQ